jgi:endonuclease-3
MAKRESLEELKKREREVVRRLKRAYPDATTALNHTNAFELLVATILSAQSTDERVNIVTADLFRKYRKPEDYLKVPASELEKDIHSTGFFRNKTKSIQGTAKLLLEKFGGQVPQTMDELLELPGVARKTANVVLGTAYGLATGFIVDTHVARVAGRLGLTKQTEPAKIEADLCRVFPEREWVEMGHRLVLHGRYLCKAKQPACAHCALQEVCPSEQHEPEGTVSERASYERGLIPERPAAG